MQPFQSSPVDQSETVYCKTRDACEYFTIFLVNHWQDIRRGCSLYWAIPSCLASRQLGLLIDFLLRHCFYLRLFASWTKVAYLTLTEFSSSVSTRIFYQGCSSQWFFTRDKRRRSGMKQSFSYFFMTTPPKQSYPKPIQY